MDINETIDTIITLIMDKILGAKIAVTENNLTQSLTDKPFEMDAITLTYLFFEIQCNLNIKISYADLSRYEFLSIHGIASIVNLLINNNTQTLAPSLVISEAM